VQDPISKAAVLLEALPYLQRFRGETFVVKYGGSFMDSPDPATRNSAARDVVFLEAAGIKPVVVHGGGKAITRALEAAGQKAAFVQGMRVTDEAAVKIVDQVLSREINPEVVAARAKPAIFVLDPESGKTLKTVTLPDDVLELTCHRSKGFAYASTSKQDVFSIDPIHAYTDKPAWDRFLQEFNEFAYKRNGIPLLNQSPFVERRHVEAAYGARWKKFSALVKEADPQRRMLNPFFADLLSE